MSSIHKLNLELVAIKKHSSYTAVKHLHILKGKMLHICAVNYKPLVLPVG